MEKGLISIAERMEEYDRTSLFPLKDYWSKPRTLSRPYCDAGDVIVIEFDEMIEMPDINFKFDVLLLIAPTNSQPLHGYIYLTHNRIDTIRKLLIKQNYYAFTVNDVAAITGLSPATVSQVMNEELSESRGGDSTCPKTSE